MDSKGKTVIVGINRNGGATSDGQLLLRVLIHSIRRSTNVWSVWLNIQDSALMRVSKEQQHEGGGDIHE